MVGRHADARDHRGREHHAADARDESLGRTVHVDGLFEARDLASDIAGHARLAVVHDGIHEIFDERQVEIRRGSVLLDAFVAPLPDP